MRLVEVVAVWLVLGSGAWCGAQEVCSKAAESAQAAAVAGIRRQLRAVKSAEEMDTDVPAAAQGLIPQLKSALAGAARAVLACHDGSADAKAVEGEIAGLLSANPPQPPAGSGVANGDPRYAEYLSVEYGSNLLLQVARPQPGLLSVQFEFHIECGDDTVWMLFEQQGTGWREKMRWQAAPYKEISGAFGDFFQAAVLPGSAGDGWRVVAAHGRPWCMSRFSGFNADVLKPEDGSEAPKVVWSIEREYSREEFEPRLRGTADGFELRLHADEMRFDSENAFERVVIYRYRVAGDTVMRVEPIAVNGRGFVEEWLSIPWDEAMAQTAPEAVAGMKAVHDRAANASHDAKTYVRFTNGPVRSCLMKGRYEVEMDADPGGREFFAIAETANGYTMMNHGATQDERCSGADLMKKKP